METTTVKTQNNHKQASRTDKQQKRKSSRLAGGTGPGPEGWDRAMPKLPATEREEEEEKARKRSRD